jgi:hypothetical protein
VAKRPASRSADEVVFDDLGCRTVARSTGETVRDALNREEFGMTCIVRFECSQP